MTVMVTRHRRAEQKRAEMRKVASVGGAAPDEVMMTPRPRVAASEDPGPAMVLKFGTMTPVAGPFVNSANPVRGIPGGGLPWVLTSACGSLSRDGHLLVRVRGLVLADQPSVPASLRGRNPFPALRVVVSCLSTGAGGVLNVANISTGDFEASGAGDADIDARVSLPQPCIAPIVLVTGPSGDGRWFAITGG